MDYPLRLAEQLRAHLKALRRQRGLTQAQLGHLIGLSQVRIADIEARPGLVGFEQIVEVLAALGATLVLRDDRAEAPPSRPAPPAARRRARAAAAAPAKATRRGSW